MKTDFTIRGELITLDALLKASGLVNSGGQAKEVISLSRVKVDGSIELRRARKLRGGEVVEFDGHEIHVHAEPAS